ncbi:MAG: tRNA preQ1(34) S-adenosylmethionine ribosyltransferase-isomerase QueA [Sinomicrobium sp.]|nr:tRNA preQ1(34) S-adenosylmethionine ribosyltransferase-isomerase QueA [Candidatus Omnitrophota bacterium]MCB0375182.1 tRNA preQ1(34) S-adenosylmethionine ribosyltransferase-isomerase QueA [Sinomicrobium sp.]
MSDDLCLENYGYHLPEELIAQYPLPDRDQARLMVIDRQTQSIRHDRFFNLAKYLPENSLIVINDSRVIPARLLGRRQTGGQVEVFLLKALPDGFSYEALIRPLKKIQEGETLCLEGDVRVTLIDKEKRIVRFDRKNILKDLQKSGHIPLPPYITRPDEPLDKEYYQTVYAAQSGSVAAPTAGLHFTDQLMDDIIKKGHEFARVTLHVNYGTFKPVEEDNITNHPMHYEEYQMEGAVYQKLNGAKTEERKVVAVGTTSCRTLESIAKTGKTRDQTNLFIYPGYDFKMVDVLITNFHLPYSTLLMLVCAFAGRDLVMKAYKEAAEQKYRFYSYGDAMIII